PMNTSQVVLNLKKAGAISIGKANMHSLAFGTTGDRSIYGAVRNPFNPKQVAGASSAGSAAGVANDFVFGSIGSDTGGSIRMPSSLCGPVGMKPTFGLISRRDAFIMSPTLDHFGPITKSVQDNALL